MRIFINIMQWSECLKSKKVNLFILFQGREYFYFINIYIFCWGVGGDNEQERSIWFPLPHI